MAADSMGLTGVYVNPEPVKKLHLQAGIIFAITGLSALLEPLTQWYLEGANPRAMPRGGTPPEDTWNFMVFKPGERPLQYSDDLAYPSWPGAPDAWGSGENFAIGAMLHGANAVEAVRVACKANPNTRPPIFGYTRRPKDGVWRPLTAAEIG